MVARHTLASPLILEARRLEGVFVLVAADSGGGVLQCGEGASAAPLGSAVSFTGAEGRLGPVRLVARALDAVEFPGLDNRPHFIVEWLALTAREHSHHLIRLLGRLGVRVHMTRFSGPLAPDEELIYEPRLQQIRLVELPDAQTRNHTRDLARRHTPLHLAEQQPGVLVETSADDGSAWRERLRQSTTRRSTSRDDTARWGPGGLRPTSTPERWTEPGAMTTEPDLTPSETQSWRPPQARDGDEQAPPSRRTPGVAWSPGPLEETPSAARQRTAEGGRQSSRQPTAEAPGGVARGSHPEPTAPPALQGAAARSDTPYPGAQRPSRRTPGGSWTVEPTAPPVLPERRQPTSDAPFAQAPSPHRTGTPLGGRRLSATVVAAAEEAARAPGRPTPPPRQIASPLGGGGGAGGRRATPASAPQLVDRVADGVPPATGDLAVGGQRLPEFAGPTERLTVVIAGRHVRATCESLGQRSLTVEVHEHVAVRQGQQVGVQLPGEPVQSDLLFIDGEVTGTAYGVRGMRVSLGIIRGGSPREYRRVVEYWARRARSQR